MEGSSSKYDDISIAFYLQNFIDINFFANLLYRCIIADVAKTATSQKYIITNNLET